MLSVQKISPLQVNPGGSVYVFGSGFDSKCRVAVNNEFLTVLDYDKDYLEFVAPEDAGNYTIIFIRDGVLFGNFSLTVVSLREIGITELPERGPDEFRNSLLGLMPKGFAWFLGKLGNWWKLFSGMADGFLTVYRVFAELYREASPATTTSYEVWENELGLPIKGLEQSTEERKLAEIYRVARKKGGVTVPYFKSLAALFGLHAEVYEYWKNPEKFDGYDFGGEDPNFYWMIAVEGRAEDWHICTCNDTCNDYLQEWSNAPAEAMFEKLKPAHTKLLCSYVDVDIELVLVDDQNDVLRAANNVPLVASVRSSDIGYTGTIALEDGTTARTVRIKDLPDAGEDNGYMVRDSEEGGTTKTRGYTDEEIDDLWDSTPAEGDDDDV